jgi:N utilization substance protein B
VKEVFSVLADGEGSKRALEKHSRSLDSMKEFAEQRIKGVLGGVAELDAALEPFLKNWEFYRLGTVERNVLRLGAWELANCPDVPAPIVINEAVDLAKFFSESQSGKFVNGVLDSYAKKLAEKPFNP